MGSLVTVAFAVGPLVAEPFLMGPLVMTPLLMGPPCASKYEYIDYKLACIKLLNLLQCRGLEPCVHSNKLFLLYVNNSH
jgi:hypothetical protein